MTAARRIVLATVIAGTLDIGWAAANTALHGKPVAGMLRSVASGPFPEAPSWGLAGALAGLLVHFAIMGVMATVFVLASARIAFLRRQALVAGALYGIGLWLVMYGVVLPARFGMPFPSPSAVEVAKQLFAHVVLVGIPIGLIARRA